MPAWRSTTVIDENGPGDVPGVWKWAGSVDGMDPQGEIRCSFCRKPTDQVKKMIAGPDDAYICDECVGLCADIIRGELAVTSNR